MTVGEIRDEVIKLLGNSLALGSHPFVSPVNYPYRWITRAVNKIPRLAAAGGRDILVTFPELYEEWQAQTQNGFAYLDRPASALVIREVYSFDKTGANADVDPYRLIAEQDPITFATGRSTTASPAYPTSWMSKASRIYFKPTPVTAYLTDIIEVGIWKQATVFNSDAQTPRIADDWHEAVTLEAARIGAVALGYDERAVRYAKEVATLIGVGVDVAAQEDLYDDPIFDLAGALTQEDVY